MSLYEVQKLLFHVNREPKMFDRFLRERETPDRRVSAYGRGATRPFGDRLPISLRDGACTRCSWDRSRPRLAWAFPITWRSSGKSVVSLVGAFAASHAPGITGRPSLPPAVESEPIFRAYDDLRSRLEAARPDVLVVVSPEHWANFFSITCLRFVSASPTSFRADG